MHKEIGGYLELERFTGPILHGDALALSSGRACLSYLIQQRGIRRILLPDYNCDVVEAVCRFYGVEIRRYPVGLNLRPRLPEAAEDDEWVYLVNFFGQLSAQELSTLAKDIPRLIIDNAQAYFEQPLPGVDVLYTCRKFLGVADGGFLYTNAPPCVLPRDESRERMDFVMGRLERGAGEFFRASQQNNDALSIQPKRMSAVTENLLHGVDYSRVKSRRTENFRLLHEALGSYNLLTLRRTEGPYAYPLRLSSAQEIRRRLIEQKIFVAQLWPNVLAEQPAGSDARTLAEEILPLPCDQRYGPDEMQAIIGAVKKCLGV